MKIQNFNSIRHFFDLQKKCPFCNTALQLVLTNWSTNAPIHDVINSSLKNNRIDFLFVNKTFKYSFQCQASIDIDQNSCSLPGSKSISVIENNIIALNNSKLQLELQCNFAKCNSTYCIRSNTLKFFISETENVNIFLYPFTLNIESFILTDKSLFVENNFMNNQFSIRTLFKKLNNSYKHEKIIIPKAIDFSNLSLDQIISKINTIILYS